MKYEKNDNFDFTSKNNSVAQVYNGLQGRLNHLSDFANCNGTDRNMFVTITRVKVGTSTPQLSQSRVMQAVDAPVSAEYVSLTFSNTIGINSGATSKMFAMVALVFGFFTLFAF